MARDRPATFTEFRCGRQRGSFANPSPAEIVVVDRQKWLTPRSEYRYDHQQDGGPLGLSDLRIPTFDGIEEVESEP
jgi:hypothetical protein